MSLEYYKPIKPWKTQEARRAKLRTRIASDAMCAMIRAGKWKMIATTGAKELAASSVALADALLDELEGDS